MERFFHPRNRQERALLARLSIPLAVMALIVIRADSVPGPVSPVPSASLTDTSAAVGEPIPADTPAPSPPENETVTPVYEKTIDVTLGKGDTVFETLRKKGIPPCRIHELVTASRSVHDLGRMQRGQTFTLAYDERDGRVLRFETRIGPEYRLIVETAGESLAARKEAIEFDVYHEVASGTINDSLFLAAHDAGLSAAMILELAEIFAWDIDFGVDMREGDAFQILYETRYLDGQFASHGRILAAKITNKGQPFTAYYFEGGDGQTDYFDADGRSLRKAFLKSPLNYKYISSRFSYRRLHPILKRYRPHLGIDYAAPTGTPVRSVGDGTIAFVGRKGGFGRYIEIRHNETYSTTYGHLRGYARGIKRGRRVTQGQVIGYVGSSGLSTGPHLDFRMLKNGTFINPLKVNFPDADPVREADVPIFHNTVAESLQEMDQRTVQERHPATSVHSVTRLI